MPKWNGYFDYDGDNDGYDDDNSYARIERIPSKSKIVDEPPKQDPKRQKKERRVGN